MGADSLYFILSQERKQNVSVKKYSWNTWSSPGIKNMSRSVFYYFSVFSFSYCLAFSQLLDIVDGSHWTTCRYIWWGHVNQHSCAPCRSPWLTERNGHFRVVINFILKQACKIIWINCSLFVYIWLQRQHQVASSNAEIYTIGI